MAEEYKDIDRLFREKLEGHSVNPSPMAWEKLQGRVAEKKRGRTPWMKLAASLLLLSVLTVLLWLSARQTGEELQTLTDNQPLPEAVQEAPLMQEAPSLEEKIKDKEATIEKKPSVKKTAPVPAKPTLAVNKLDEPLPPIREPERVHELQGIELPPLDTELLVAETTIDTSEDFVPDQVAYKVTIISNGIKATPEKETLVGEIENKIEKIGGLIGKVDQGFADLQDAKNNLFASITTKK